MLIGSAYLFIVILDEIDKEHMYIRALFSAPVDTTIYPRFD